jgi:hypothetical protein
MTTILLAILAAEPSSLIGFAGFSADGSRFAWVAPGASKAMSSQFVKIAKPGSSEPEMSMFFPDEASSVKKARETLKGFTTRRTPAPKDLTIDAQLTQSPPKLALVRGGKRVEVDLGKYPYEKTDVAELWGVSSDGKHVAIHIHGPDVPGVLSKGGGNDFVVYVIAPVP